MQKYEHQETQKKSQKSYWKFKLFMVLLIGLVLAVVYGYHRWWPQLWSAGGDFALKTDVEQKFAEMDRRFNLLNKELSALRTESQNEPISQVGDNILVSDEFYNQFEQFKQEVNSRLAAWNEEHNFPVTTENSPETEIRIDKTPEILLASGALIVRDIAETGSPFEYEAEVLQILARNNKIAEKYADDVRQYANSGIKGREALIHSFIGFYPVLSDAPLMTELKSQEVVSEDENKAVSWQDKALFWLKKIVTQKKKAKKPIFNHEQDEVYQLVSSGKLFEAINLLKTNGEYAKIDATVLNEWKNQVQNYLSFERAINGLIMNALANIRLKEMEH